MERLTDKKVTVPLTSPLCLSQAHVEAYAIGHTASVAALLLSHMRMHLLKQLFLCVPRTVSALELTSDCFLSESRLSVVHGPTSSRSSCSEDLDWVSGSPLGLL